MAGLLAPRAVVCAIRCLARYEAGLPTRCTRPAVARAMEPPPPGNPDNNVPRSRPDVHPRLLHAFAPGQAARFQAPAPGLPARAPEPVAVAHPASFHFVALLLAGAAYSATSAAARHQQRIAPGTRLLRPQCRVCSMICPIQNAPAADAGCH